MKEEHLLTGPLEPTNEGYALAKISGIKMVEYYRRQYGCQWISVMPCNLYGTNDCFDPERSHVISALVKKAVDAADEGRAAVEVWGTGAARREFLHVDDAASGIFHALEFYDAAQFINLGSGEDVTIRELAGIVMDKAGFHGEVIWNTDKPDGMPRKCLDVSRITALGWKPEIALDVGIARMVEEYRGMRG